MAIKAKTIPTIPVQLNFSLKIKIPIKMVAKRLITDQIVPTVEREFL